MADFPTGLDTFIPQRPIISKCYLMQYPIVRILTDFNTRLGPREESRPILAHAAHGGRC